ncbi:hypothetical protein Z949_502 [Sulfitobacter guttiformis KCTC 32187]|nr:hypothetical protein Z949_502 [Sulfitobacter guttiformis KCTC 32187]
MLLGSCRGETSRAAERSGGPQAANATTNNAVRYFIAPALR